jgi:hypothetical protein
MIFDEWIKQFTPSDMYHITIAKLAWETGAKVEREACAEVAESAASDDNKYDIADAIRAKSDT